MTDPLRHLRAGDPHPGYEHLVIDDGDHDACEANTRAPHWGMVACTRPPGHAGQHVATAPDHPVIAAWGAPESFCGANGPPPMPRGWGYLCTRPDGHDGAHEVWVDGARIDSWTSS